MSSRVALDLHEHTVTDGDAGAFYLSHDGTEANARWIPKSLCQKIADGKFSIDAWKARQAGFLIPRGLGQGSFDL